MKIELCLHFKSTINIEILKPTLKITGIIPARYASTRFPGKPLVEIMGKPMIQRVYECAKQSGLLTDVVVATDDKRIQDCVLGFGGKSILTSSEHKTGTDRCAEAAVSLYADFDAVINIQGDEPFIDPQQIDLVAGCFFEPEVEIATLINKVKNTEDLFNPNRIKVVKDLNDFALYFSRSPVPYSRDKAEESWVVNHPYYLHIGIYGFRVHTLLAITKLAQSSLEKAESLEQLRWMENGYKIKTRLTDIESISIDTPEDLNKINK